MAAPVRRVNLLTSCRTGSGFFTSQKMSWHGNGLRLGCATHRA